MGDGQRRGVSAVTAAAALNEPTRRRVFEAVRAHGGPTTRDHVASTLGIGRPIAAFHLDALARAGLLDVDFARPPGRRGPGAGRPAKRYRVCQGDIVLSVPERRYDLAGQILAAGVRDAGKTGDARAATFAAAREKGRALGQSYELDQNHADAEPKRRPRNRVCEVLTDLGYEPVDDNGPVRLRNCPFHAVVDVDPELVCHMNLHMLEGLIDGLDLGGLHARFAPTPGECCVHVSETG